MDDAALVGSELVSEEALYDVKDITDCTRLGLGSIFIRGEYNVDNLKLILCCHKSCKTHLKRKKISIYFSIIKELKVQSLGLPCMLQYRGVQIVNMDQFVPCHSLW